MPQLQLRPSSGFTLIELMVVIVILGIVASFAVLSVGSRDGDEALKEEVQRLASLIEIASEEAVITARQIGLQLSPEGYRFLVYDQQQWKPLEEDDLLRPRLLPTGLDVELRLYIDGLLVSLKQPLAEQRDGDQPKEKPQLVLLSSGEQTPAELVFAPRFDAGSSFRLLLPPLGRPQWQRLGEVR